MRAGTLLLPPPAREVFNDAALGEREGGGAYRELKRDKKRVSKCQHDLRTYARASMVVRSTTIRTWPSTRDATCALGSSLGSPADYALHGIHRGPPIANTFAEDERRLPESAPSESLTSKLRPFIRSKRARAQRAAARVVRLSYDLRKTN